MAMFTIFERKVILFTHFAIPLSPTLCEAGLTMNTGSAATIVMKEEEEEEEEKEEEMEEVEEVEEEEMKEGEVEEERGKDKSAGNGDNVSISHSSAISVSCTRIGFTTFVKLEISRLQLWSNNRQSGSHRSSRIECKK